MKKVFEMQAIYGHMPITCDERVFIRLFEASSIGNINNNPDVVVDRIRRQHELLLILLEGNFHHYDVVEDVFYLNDGRRIKRVLGNSNLARCYLSDDRIFIGTSDRFEELS